MGEDVTILLGDSEPFLKYFLFSWKSCWESHVRGVDTVAHRTLEGLCRGYIGYTSPIFMVPTVLCPCLRRDHFCSGYSMLISENSSLQSQTEVNFGNDIYLWQNIVPEQIKIDPCFPMPCCESDYQGQNMQ